MRTATRGITTVELIVVMLVMGLLSALAIPRLTERSALQERAARDQLRGMLLQGRKIAMTQQRDVCVLTAATQATVVYAAVGGGACNAALPVADPGGGGPWRIDMPAGISLSGATQVRFNPRGQLVPATDQTLNVGTSTLTVSRETGITL